MKSLSISWFIFFLFTSALHSQEFSKNEIDRMILTFAFNTKQMVSLEIIGSQFPELKEDVRIASNDWNREFKSSVDNIDTLLTRQLHQSWIEKKTEIRDKYLRADYSRTAEKEASQFILSVMQRANAKIESPILETLLIYKPQYQQSPELEISDGYTQKYTTREANKSLPVNIILIIPQSWKQLSGSKKGSLPQTFVSNLGEGPMSVSLLAERGRTEYSDENIQQQLTQEFLQKTLVKSGSVITYKTLKIDGRPAAMISFYKEEKKKEGPLNTITESYVTHFKSCRITLNFTTSSSTQNAVQLKPKIRKNQALIRKIIDNVVILSQWGM